MSTLNIQNSNIIIRFFLLIFSKIFCLTNAYCLVVRYVDKQIYCLDQGFSNCGSGSHVGSRNKLAFCTFEIGFYNKYVTNFVRES